MDEARGEVVALEQLRPLWAQGYSSDSIAAQASGNALSDIWSSLGVNNQTDAMERLHKMIDLLESIYVDDDGDGYIDKIGMEEIQNLLENF